MTAPPSIGWISGKNQYEEAISALKENLITRTEQMVYLQKKIPPQTEFLSAI